MPRRRYRLLTVCSVFLVFVLYRMVHSSWDIDRQPVKVQRPPPPVPQPPPPAKPASTETELEPADGQRKPLSGDASRLKQVVQEATNIDGHQDPKSPFKNPSNNVDGKQGTTWDGGGATVNNDDIHWKRPPKAKGSTGEASSNEDQIHWRRPIEHFPVPTESVIPLPTASPQKLPQIQYNFRPETEQAKAKRLDRQKRVKAELERSWASYRKRAWMHDELMPVSGKYRDPFCGWAATLVDTLDTLWIAGMTDAFDEAAKAAKDIDFTYTDRHSIPVFETTIRYLGGLLAAFDVSGGAQGKYSFLLDKAVELAEILLGAFDTPNRMPLLYYQWKPEHASQPRRASRVSIAELASLSLEFTRLAQLTAQDRYYDAIDRITNALVALQNEGTLIPGLFPETLDATGCNRTAETVSESLSQAAKDQVDSQEPLGEPVGFTQASKGLDSVLDMNRRKQRPTSHQGPVGRRSLESVKESEARAGGGSTKQRGPFGADGKVSEWDCVPQGLVPGGFGYQRFHLGGAQDSAYEYFPKQYLLLGGREPKYQKLYQDAVEATNEWLLFRPMLTGDWDVMFPAKVGTMGDAAKDLDPEYEVTHLTCFVGGMYGLGGRIFGREQDVELAKKLTDGCVWAYQITASGIMPEYSRVVPCPTLEKCEFNQTQWWEGIDPSKEWRDDKVRQWDDEQQKALNKAKGDKTLTRNNERGEGFDTGRSASLHGASGNMGQSDGTLGKRAAVPVQRQDKSTSAQDEGSKLPQSLENKLGRNQDGGDTASEFHEADSPGSDMKPASDASAGVKVQVPTSPRAPGGKFRQPTSERPATHEEYVKSRIEQDQLPPGFVTIPSTGYLLRPEAIESVWYMYRITGDPSWMDKGWDMFQATVHATRTALANSAVSNVLSSEPELKDEMESFWTAETLKYYYLLFSEPDVISLDEWVLNTEAHPFKLS
ncbi:hypothetical protein CDD82_6408 [Ophiocordyceps australis]|uniref:alpha-1,2-Mannosidase n=1 Tax=Ophiocordyceps australis TaxID=1399860 RepID=A0A2C5ZR40_9HYPO|nr:hypothetical protein CDD82_6408 [Ophiocordyceps australis]